MISLFPSEATEFETNGIIMNEWISFEITQSLNGEYTFKGEYPVTGNKKYLQLSENNILRAPTPEGLQSFRIYMVEKRIESIVVEGFHVFYDLHGNNIRNFFAVGNGDTIIKKLLSSAENEHPFTGSSDIESSHQFSFNEAARNPVHALLSGKHCITYLWGGEIQRDNFHIYLKDRIGEDTNVSIEYGKNLLDFTNKSNVGEIATRIIGTYSYNIKDDNGEIVTITLIAQVDSPLINNYPYIATANVAIEDTDDSLNIRTEVELEEYLINTYFNQNNVDKPKFSLTIDWIKQNHYEDLKLGDTALVKHGKYNFEYRLKITKYTYDCILEEYTELFFGDFEGIIEGEIATLSTGLSNIQGAVSNHTSSIYELNKRLSDLENPVYYPNQVYNSSFERFDENGVPDFWKTTGVVSSIEHLVGENSLRLATGQFAQMQNKPIQTFKWADSSTKFTIRVIGKGKIRLSSLSDGVVQPVFSYVNNQYIQRNYFEFEINTMNWFDSKCSIELHPTLKVAELRIECITGTVYIDAVSATPVPQGSRLDIQYTDGAMNYNDAMSLRNDDLANAKLGEMWFRTDL